jgi:hypothetical protein
LNLILIVTLVHLVFTRRYISSTVNMRAAAVLSVLSLVTGGNAWAQAANGEWIANMQIYDVTNGGWASKFATRNPKTFQNMSS